MVCEYQLFMGNAEQFRYTIIGTKREVFKTLREYYLEHWFGKGVRFYKVPTRGNYPPGAAHYKIVGRNVRFLLINWGEYK